MNKKNTYRICISSPSDRDKLAAEIFFENVQWVEINQENNVLEVEFYPRPDSQPWKIDFSEVIGALREAKSRLVGITEENLSGQHDTRKDFRIIIASLPHYKNCVCEIYYNHVEWADISQETEEIEIKLYSHPTQNYWEFPLDIALRGCCTTPT